MKYKIKVIEKLEKVVKIEAEDLKEAVTKAKDCYENDGIILDCEDYAGCEYKLVGIEI